MSVKVKILIALALLLIGGGIAYATYRKGLLATGAPTLKAKKTVSLKDPCPGSDTIWDAVLGKCIPFVEEPVAISTASNKSKKVWQ
jgi:hypothetical protein